MEIRVIDKNGKPLISLDGEITKEDICNVDEKPNALIFILDDDKGWTFNGKKAKLQVRFRMADEFKEKMKDYLKDGTIWAYATQVFKVHTFEVQAFEATKEKEDEIKEWLVKILNKSLSQIKLLTDGSF